MSVKLKWGAKWGSKPQMDDHAPWTPISAATAVDRLQLISISSKPTFPHQVATECTQRNIPASMKRAAAN